MHKFACKAIRMVFPFLVLMVGSLHAFAQTHIGVQLYTYRQQLQQDLPGTLKAIAALPVQFVEGGNSYGLEPGAFKKLLDKNGLKLISLNASFEDLERSPAEVAAKAKSFGAEYVVCTWIPHKGDSFSLADAQRAVKVFNAAGKILKGHQISFAYHPHGFEFQKYQDGTFFDYLVKNMDPQYANFQMDVFWFHHSGQDAVYWLQQIPQRFLSLHLKDRRLGTVNDQLGRADVETNVVLGAGDVPIAAIMGAAKAAGIRYYFIEDESSRCQTQVPLSLLFLQGFK